jgi:alkanesulfonate monooxygenase
LAGFNGLLLPNDPAGDEPWILGSALARETRHLRIVPEFPANLGSAVYTAKLAFTFQRFFNDRLGWMLALDQPATESSGDRLLRSKELLVVAEGVWGETPFDYNGRYFAVENGALFALHRSQNVRVAPRRFPTVYVAGESDELLAFSAAHADVHLFDTVERSALRALIERHRALSARAGRAVRYGLRLSIAAREYESEAWTASQRLWDERRPGYGEAFASRRVDENAWTGFANAGHAFDGALVGTYADVADQLHAYRDAGISTFILDAVPRVEEAYRVGEYVLPLIAARRREAVG